MSGYKTEDGTDLDDIFYVNNSDANINDEFLIDGKTGTGRYISRPDPSEANSQNDVGFITSGDEDLNRLYLKNGESYTKSFTIQGGSNSKETSKAKGAKMVVSIKATPNTTIHFITIAGGAGGDATHVVMSLDGQSGGSAVAISTDSTLSDSNLLAIVGGAGGFGGRTYTAKGGDAGYTGGTDYDNFKVYNGSYGTIGTEIRGGDLYQLPTASPGGSTTNYGIHSAGHILYGAKARYQRGSATAIYWAPGGNYGNSYNGGPGSYVSGSSTSSFVSAYNYYGGGGGGSGFRGGAGGAAALVGRARDFRNDCDEGGGGGGSSAYRYKNFPSGIESINISIEQHEGGVYSPHTTFTF